MNKCTVIVLIFTISSFSQTFLSGTIKGVFPRDNYIITGNISVKFGDTLRLEPGTELRFKPNTGLSIRGVLIAEGKIDNAIIFTSAQEQEVRSSTTVSKSNHWWKGVNLSASKVLSRLSYCLFCFSDTALSIKNTYQKIDLNHVVFHKNRNANLIWAGKTIETKDDEQYVYRMDTNGNTSKKDIPKIKSASDASHGFRSGFKAVGRPIFSILAIAGAGMWAFGYMKSEEYNKQYLDVKVNDRNKIISLREKRDQMVDFGNTGIATFMIGAGAFFVTFVF